jgi:hypothetical protein
MGAPGAEAARAAALARLENMAGQVSGASRADLGSAAAALNGTYSGQQGATTTITISPGGVVTVTNSASGETPVVPANGGASATQPPVPGAPSVTPAPAPVDNTVWVPVKKKDAPEVPFGQQLLAGGLGMGMAALFILLLL